MIQREREKWNEREIERERERERKSILTNGHYSTVIIKKSLPSIGQTEIDTA